MIKRVTYYTRVIYPESLSWLIPQSVGHVTWRWSHLCWTLTMFTPVSLRAWPLSSSSQYFLTFSSCCYLTEFYSSNHSYLFWFLHEVLRKEADTQTINRVEESCMFRNTHLNVQCKVTRLDDKHKFSFAMYECGVWIIVFAISWDLTFSSAPVSVRGLLVWPGSCNVAQNRK